MDVTLHLPDAFEERLTLDEIERIRL